MDSAVRLLATPEVAAAETTTADEREAVRRHCGVFTRPVVVEAMLDAIGWRADAPLESARLLEPACGDGAFVVSAAQRLVARLRSEHLLDERHLADRIVAFEFDPATARAAHVRVADVLESGGLDPAASRHVAARWVRTADFLLEPPQGTFTHVVGNPPYMRWSRVGTGLRQAYGAALPAFVARGDLCVPFIWRSVELLAPGGQAALLCSDRWLRCGYGRLLRAAIGSVACLAAHFEVHAASLFEGTRRVQAYPAVSIFRRGSGAATAFGRLQTAKDLASALRVWGRAPSGNSDPPASAPTISPQASVLAERDIEACARALLEGGVPLPDVGLHVRCGMALGHAAAFLIDDPDEVDPGRALPYATTADIDGSATVSPSRWIADVWDHSGRLVELEDFPRLRARLERYRNALSARACVRTPHEWHRTIDRKDPAVLSTRRLAVAGMSRRARVGLLPSGIALANSAYAVFGDGWPLEQLRWLLVNGPLDAIALASAPRFAGGTLRFDGNLLRRVPVPRYESVPQDVKDAIQAAAAGSRAVGSAELIASMYGIRDRVALSGLHRILREREA